MKAAPEELLGLIEGKWAAMSQVLAAEPSPGTWSLAEVYAHLARWDDAACAGVMAHVEGSPTDEVDSHFADYRGWNARWAAEDASVDLERAREWAKSAHGRLVQSLRSLNREDWDKYVIEMAQETVDHYQAHIQAPLEFEART